MSLITFFSIKGGVGVTSIAANVAAYLAKSGLNVTAADLSGTDELKVLVGVPPGQEARGSSSRFASSQQQHGVNIASAPSTMRPMEDRLAFLSAASAFSEVVVADLSLLDADLRHDICGKALLNICVVSADAGSIISLPRVMDVKLSMPNARFVVNNFDSRRRVGVEAAALFDKVLGRSVISTIRRDEAVNEAAATLEPLTTFAPTSAAARDMSELAKSVQAGLPVLLSHIA